MYKIELFTQKKIEKVGFFYVLRLKEKRSTWLISYISYDSICPQHLSSRKFDFIIFIYDRPMKKGTLTDVVIQTVLYQGCSVLYANTPVRTWEIGGIFLKRFSVDPPGGLGKFIETHLSPQRIDPDWL